MKNHLLLGFVCMCIIIYLIWPSILIRNSIMEDALITARYSRNLANGLGLVYSPDQFILGTTTPVWAIIISLIFLLPVNVSLQVFLIQLLSLIFFVSAIVVLMRDIPLRPSRFLTLAGLIALMPISVHVPTMGMETGAVIFFAIVLWRSLSCKISTIWLALVRVMSVMLLLGLRLDSAIYLASIFVAYLVIYRPKISDDRGVRDVVLGGIVFSVLWAVSVVPYYGALLPQSMLAKAGLQQGVSFFSILSAVPLNIQGLLALNFPFPVIISWLQPNMIIFLASIFVFWLVWLNSAKLKHVRFLLLTALIYLLSYSLFFSIGRVGLFPWYSHVPSFLFFGSIALGLTIDKPLINTLFDRVVFDKVFLNGFLRYVFTGSMIVLIVGLLGMGLLDLRGRLLMFFGVIHNIHTSYREVGDWLYQKNAMSVMLEPIGYIGFFSEVPVVYDLAGLVSPDVYVYRKTQAPGWFAEAVKAFNPEYIVLRDNEIEKNIGWNVGILFRDDDQRTNWQRSYQQVFRSQGDYSQNIVVVYQRVKY